LLTLAGLANLRMTGRVLKISVEQNFWRDRHLPTHRDGVCTITLYASRPTGQGNRRSKVVLHIGGNAVN
jgi:hypothetical protein